MANPIKYSVATQSNSIKAGNFAVGVNKGGYGPTNITNFYNGKTPNVGGYTVYVSNGSGSPSIFVAGNDATLITLSNQLGGSGITTIEAALNFFNASSTMLCTNIDYTNIVTSGLVVNLDATYTPSYPKNGITWKDLSGNGNNGTLVNGPTFSNGSLFFDGIDDLCRFSASTFNTGSPQNGTFILDMTFPILNTTVSTILFSDGGSAGSLIYLYRNSNFAVDSYNWLMYSDTGSKSLSGTYSPGQRYQAAFTFDSLGNVAAYRNGTLINSGTWSVGSTSWNRSGTNQPSIRPSSLTGNTGSVSLFLHYNRALSSAEILQNYYAGLQRLIPTDSLVLSLDAQNPNRRISSQTIAYDVSNNNYHGTFSNITFSTDGGTSLVFNGVSSYVDIGVKPLLSPQSLTVSVWFKISSSLAFSIIVRSRIYGWGITVTGTTLSSMLYTSVSNQINSTGSTISLNVYNHVSITYTASTFCMYLNGVQVYTTTSPTNSIYYVNGYIAIGRDADASASYFSGNISTVQMYSRALSATEVSTIYNATKSRYGL